jgi:hypothetical protein
LELNDDGSLQVIWDKQYWPKSAKNKARTKSWLQQQIRRLLRLKHVDWNFTFDEKKDEIGMTRYEWETIWQYVDANVVAMGAAIDSLEDMNVSPDTCSGDDGEDGTCTAAPALSASSHYDMLEEEWDDLPYAQDTCNFRTWMDTYKKKYPIIESLSTMYQDLVFKDHPGHDDVCMELDRIVQVGSCSVWMNAIARND